MQPYVAVLHGHELLTITRWDQPSLAAFKPKLAALLSQRFLKHVRERTLDPAVNRTQFMDAVSMTAGASTAVVKAYHQHAPHQLVQLSITSVVLQSPQSIALRWLETTRDPHSGERLSQQAFSAVLTFRFVALRATRRA